MKQIVIGGIAGAALTAVIMVASVGIIAKGRRVFLHERKASIEELLREPGRLPSIAHEANDSRHLASSSDGSDE